MDGSSHGATGRMRLRQSDPRWLRLAIVVCAVIAAFGGVPPTRTYAQTSLEGTSLRAASKVYSSDDPAAAAIVLYNETDPLSRDLADYYAARRGIDRERVVGLKCSNDEEISREDYDANIAGPLRAVFDERHWWTRNADRPGERIGSVVTGNRVRFVVSMRGIPLRIRPTANYPGDFSNQPSPIKDQNAASVDSELAVLGLFTRGISGVLPNPLFRSYARFNEAQPPGIMLTGRLDAPTGTMVRRMIDDALTVEQAGLWGRCYVDGRGLVPGQSPLAEGDEWMQKIATDIAPYNLPTVYDNLDPMFPVHFPMDEAAMYFGWYSEQPSGPFTREDFRFRPGAVACHIHSFSATSVRDPFHWWVGPLLNRGADAVLGNVYEPYLPLTTHLDVFAARLCDGYTLAESAWEATPALSWMNTVVGDPLYRPGKFWRDLEFNLDSAGSPPPGQPAVVTEGKAYRQAAQIWHARGAKAGRDAMEKSANRLHSGMIYEGMAELEANSSDLPRALAAYEQAAKDYRNEPADIARVVIAQVRLLNKAGQKSRAAQVLAVARRDCARNAGATVLAEFADELAASK